MFMTAIPESLWVGAVLGVLGTVYALVKGWKDKAEKLDTLKTVEDKLREEIAPMEARLKDLEDEGANNKLTNLRVSDIYKKLDKLDKIIEDGLKSQAETTRDAIKEIKEILSEDSKHIRGRIQHLYDTKQDKK